MRAEAWSETSDRLADPSLRRLAYWPGGRQNPYLELLYSRCPEVGFLPSPLTRYSDLEELPPGTVFHLHWTRGAQLGAATPAEARTMTTSYLAPIEAFVARGGTLLWSVHEEAPHDVAFPEVERELRTRLAELADGIHLLHESTRQIVEPHYRLPEDKTFVVEHPLYTGYYPTYMTRDAARRRLGVQDGTALVVGFGALRPYKGFERLIDSLDHLRTTIDRPVQVLIAGPTMQHADTSELEARAAGRSDVTLSVGPVPVSDVQVLFHAADVVALPYRKVMNSGVLMLALTCFDVLVWPPTTRSPRRWRRQTSWSCSMPRQTRLWWRRCDAPSPRPIPMNYRKTSCAGTIPMSSPVSSPATSPPSQAIGRSRENHLHLHASPDRKQPSRRRHAVDRRARGTTGVLQPEPL